MGGSRWGWVLQIKIPCHKTHPSLSGCSRLKMSLGLFNINQRLSRCIGTIAVSWISCWPSPALPGGFIASCCACCFYTRTGRRHASLRFLTMGMRNHTLLGLLTVRLCGMETGISKTSKRVSIFPFATQGGKKESFYFRQGN